MKHRFLMTLLLINTFSYSTTQAQTLSAPVAEDVFGGTVLDVESWQFDSDSVYVAVSTESPNSIFVGKAYRNATREDLSFRVLESADADNGYGSTVSNIEVHEASNTIFFLSQGSVYRTGLNSTSATSIQTLVKTFLIQGDTMCLVKNNPLPLGDDTLEFGPIDVTGNFTPTNGFSLLRQYTQPPQMVIDPSTNQLHLFDRSATPHLYMFGDPFNAMSNATMLTPAISPAPSLPNIEWQTFGFAPDGTWYVTGQPPLNNPNIVDRTIAWSYNNGFNWFNSVMDGPGPQGGVVGSNLVIEDFPSARHIFCGELFQTDTANMVSWQNPGAVYISELNRANDGKTEVDPIINDIKYHTTNIGFGYSVSAGDSIFGWNDGLEAVQVNDIDMNTDFSIGWVASKSGIRKVEDYNTPTPIWASPIFPNFDGAPYEAVAMDPTNDQKVFVGNQRVYMTTNGGVSTGPGNDGWNKVFSPEMPPYNFNSINAKCQAIEVSPDDPNVVMAVYSIAFNDKGGLFYSLDGGANWDQLLLNATALGQDLDVTDIEFAFEGGNVVAYVGVEADVLTSGAYGLFRAELAGGVWSVAHDGSYGATDAIIDLEMNATRDTLIVLNFDPGLLPVNNVQLKDLNTNTWVSIPGPSASGTATAITIGDGYAFLAMDERVYTSPFTGPFSWSLGYAYPVGTEINVLFYDELLVGTGTGLYAHDLDAGLVGLTDQQAVDASIYPNPSTGEFTIESSELISEIRVYELSGRIIINEAPKASKYVLNLTDAVSGMYIIELMYAPGSVSRSSVVIE